MGTPRPRGSGKTEASPQGRRQRGDDRNAPCSATSTRHAADSPSSHRALFRFSRCAPSVLSPWSSRGSSPVTWRPHDQPLLTRSPAPTGARSPLHPLKSCTVIHRVPPRPPLHNPVFTEEVSRRPLSPNHALSQREDFALVHFFVSFTGLTTFPTAEA